MLENLSLNAKEFDDAIASAIERYFDNSDVITFPELTAATSIAGADIIPGIFGGVDKSVTFNLLQSTLSLTASQISNFDSAVNALLAAAINVPNGIAGLTSGKNVMTSSAVVATSGTLNILTNATINQDLQQSASPAFANVTIATNPVITTFAGRAAATSTNNIVPTAGDYTSDMITPGTTNLYFTNARAIASTLTGFSATNAVVTSADSILSSAGKLQGQISAITSLTQANLTTLLANASYSPSIAGGLTVTGAAQFNSTLNSFQINAYGSATSDSSMQLSARSTANPNYTFGVGITNASSPYGRFSCVNQGTGYLPFQTLATQNIMINTQTVAAGVAYSTFATGNMLIQGLTTLTTPVTASIQTLINGQIAPHRDTSGNLNFRLQTGLSTFVDYSLGGLANIAAIAAAGTWGGSNAFTNGGTALFGQSGVAIGAYTGSAYQWAMTFDNLGAAYANSTLFINGDVRSAYAANPTNATGLSIREYAPASTAAYLNLTYKTGVMYLGYLSSTLGQPAGGTIFTCAWGGTVWGAVNYYNAGGITLVNSDNGSKTTTATWTVTSDEKYKDRSTFESMDVALSTSLIKKLELLHYKHTDKRAKQVGEDVKNKPEHMGLTAQQLRGVIPEAVTEDEDGTLLVNYHYVYKRLIASHQNLIERIEKLETVR
jgi:hypothetical protein